MKSRLARILCIWAACRSLSADAYCGDEQKHNASAAAPDRRRTRHGRAVPARPTASISDTAQADHAETERTVKNKRPSFQKRHVTLTFPPRAAKRPNPPSTSLINSARECGYRVRRLPLAHRVYCGMAPVARFLWV